MATEHSVAIVLAHGDDCEGCQQMKRIAFAAIKSTPPEVAEVVHRCPPKGSGTMPCCGKTPFEVSTLDRITLVPENVTCSGRTD